MTATATYELNAIRHRISESFTLEIDALRVEAGETLCLVGPTGAGKSTLLRLLSGLCLPTSGQIKFQDAPIGPSTPVATLRQIVTAHQSPLLLSQSVRRNIEYGLRVRGMSNHRERIDPILDALGLTPYANQLARTLSGGQRQLVAVGRALAVGAEVLLLDEPTSHLDPSHVGRVEALVQERRASRPLTVVWVTHNLFQAERMADRVGLILSGQLIEVAPTADFFHRPADERTSAFIHGKMVY